MKTILPRLYVKCNVKFKKPLCRSKMKVVKSTLASQKKENLWFKKLYYIHYIGKLSYLKHLKNLW